MAKLYFRYGAMGSAKTLNLLAVAHNYRSQGKKVLILKPGLDDRFGTDKVRSRAGLEQEADVLLWPKTRLNLKDLLGISCLLVDEAHFLNTASIEHLRQVATLENIPVICYGLRTDFRSYLFEGSKRLIELADSIEEVKTTCAFCNRKATMNLKHLNGVATMSGPTVDLGAEEKYMPVCHGCYEVEHQKAAIDTEKRVAND